MPAMRPCTPLTLLLTLLLAGCGGRVFDPEAGVEAGTDLPHQDADAGPDLPITDAKPDALDGKPPVTDAKPDAPDAKPPVKDINHEVAPDQKPPDTKTPDLKPPDLKPPDTKPPDLKPPDTKSPDILSPDIKPPDMGPDLLPGNWVTLQAGSFDMGSPPSESCRQNTASAKETLHPVTLTNKLMIMNAEVTQKDFQTIMGYNNSTPIHGDYPVHYVNWHHAAAYCDGLTTLINGRLSKQGKKLLTHCYKDKAAGQSCGDCPKLVGSQTAACSKQGNKMICMDYLYSSPVPNIYDCDGFRLPTEAEWEYAYRAGKQTPLYQAGKCDGTITQCYLKDNNASIIGWYQQDTLVMNKVNLGKQRLANAWGLYDMAGNVAEWVHDGWTADLGAAKKTNPVTGVSPGIGAQLVRRGGSIIKSPSALRAAYRTFFVHKAIAKDMGLRCVRTVK